MKPTNLKAPNNESPLSDEDAVNYALTEYRGYPEVIVCGKGSDYAPVPFLLIDQHDLEPHEHHYHLVAHTAEGCIDMATSALIYPTIERLLSRIVATDATYFIVSKCALLPEWDKPLSTYIEKLNHFDVDYDVIHKSQL